MEVNQLKQTQAHLPNKQQDKWGTAGSGWGAWNSKVRKELEWGEGTSRQIGRQSGSKLQEQSWWAHRRNTEAQWNARGAANTLPKASIRWGLISGISWLLQDTCWWTPGLHPSGPRTTVPAGDPFLHTCIFSASIYLNKLPFSSEPCGPYSLDVFA